MRQLAAFCLMVALVPGAALAQRNTPPLLTPMPPVVLPPPPVAPPPVPSVVTPLPQPSYGVPPNISTTMPPSAAPRVIYRQPAEPPRKKRFRKRRYYGASQ